MLKEILWLFIKKKLLKNSFMKKCLADNKASCEERAVGKDGKKLAGAAKNSFMKKCEAAAG